MDVLEYFCIKEINNTKIREIISQLGRNKINLMCKKLVEYDSNAIKFIIRKDLIKYDAMESEEENNLYSALTKKISEQKSTSEDMVCKTYEYNLTKYGMQCKIDMHRTGFIRNRLYISSKSEDSLFSNKVYIDNLPHNLLKNTNANISSKSEDILFSNKVHINYVDNLPRIIGDISTTESCKIVCKKNPFYLRFISKELIDQELCEIVCRQNALSVLSLPDNLQVEELCEFIFGILRYIPKKFITKKLYKIIRANPHINNDPKNYETTTSFEEKYNIDFEKINCKEEYFVKKYTEAEKNIVYKFISP